MKKVNFIEAVEYAKQGKEVYCKLKNYGKQYFIFYKKEIGIENIFILDESIYNQVKDGVKADLYEYSSNNIEFRLNKWTVKDE